MKVELENVKPMDIEKRSFEIITEELGDKKLVPGTELIVKRCIHTSADFDYAENLCFSENAVEKAIAAIKDGACIVTWSFSPYLLYVRNRIVPDLYGNNRPDVCLSNLDDILLPDRN